MKCTNHKAYIFKGKHIQLWNNKKGSSYWFVYILAFAFILAILYIVFGQILNVYLYPTSSFISNGNMIEQNKWLRIWGWVPFMLTFIIITFLYMKLTQTSSGE